MLDEIFGLGAAQRVQGGQLLFARGLKLAVAALALLNALDDGVSARSSSGCRLAITRALSRSTAL